MYVCVPIEVGLPGGGKSDVVSMKDASNCHSNRGYLDLKRSGGLDDEAGDASGAPDPKSI